VGEKSYSPIHSYTSALDEGVGVGGQRQATAALTLVKETRYPLYKRPGWRPGLGICENLTPHLDSIPGPSSPYRVVKIAKMDATVAFCKGRLKSTQLHWSLAAIDQSSEDRSCSDLHSNRYTFCTQGM